MSYSMSVNTYHETSLGMTAETSTGDQTTTSEVGALAIVGTQSPDDSTSLSTDALADATAFGTDTLAMAGISGEAVDSGAVATLDVDIWAVAISEAEDDTAFADAYTSATISDGAELFAIITVESQETQQNSSGSVSVSTSETSVTAIDLDPSEVGGADAGNATDAWTDDIPLEPDASDEPPAEEDQADSPAPSTDDEPADLIDGNVAIALVDFEAEADGTSLEIDAFALALEDEGSIVNTFVIAEITA